MALFCSGDIFRWLSTVSGSIRQTWGLVAVGAVLTEAVNMLWTRSGPGTVYGRMRLVDAAVCGADAGAGEAGFCAKTRAFVVQWALRSVCANLRRIGPKLWRRQLPPWLFAFNFDWFQLEFGLLARQYTGSALCGSLLLNHLSQ